MGEEDGGDGRVVGRAEGERLQGSAAEEGVEGFDAVGRGLSAGGEERVADLAEREEGWVDVVQEGDRVFLGC